MSDPDNVIGQMVGNYRLVQKLGEGGMGAVYLGEHPDIESRVAIKVLHPRRVDDEDVVRRFFDEARATNRVTHRGVVRIHDCGRQGELGVYLVMEYLQGRNLKERADAEGLPMGVAAVVRIVHQVAATMEACHKAGILHRDLKPANIFLVKDSEAPGGERVKVLDFGLAKLLESQGEEGATRTGATIGTPRYMSPEQCLDTKMVDERTDVYAVGVMAYHLLSGHFPFVGDTIGKLVLAQQTTQPVRLSGHNAVVPEPMAALVHEALAVEREQRTATMAALRQGIEEVAAALDLETNEDVTDHGLPPGPRPAPSAPVDPEASTLSGSTGESIGSWTPRAPGDNEDAWTPRVPAEVSSTGNWTPRVPSMRFGRVLALAVFTALAITALVIFLQPQPQDPPQGPASQPPLVSAPALALPEESPDAGEPDQGAHAPDLLLPPDLKKPTRKRKKKPAPKKKAAPKKGTPERGSKLLFDESL